jgi:hypothetical protein
MPEARKSPRRATSQRCVAVLGSRAEIECTIKDMSAAGARLTFRHAAFLPKTFQLRFGQDERRVTVVWQRGLSAGVRFQEPVRMQAAPKKRRLGFW